MMSGAVVTCFFFFDQEWFISIFMSSEYLLVEFFTEAATEPSGTTYYNLLRSTPTSGNTLILPQGILQIISECTPVYGVYLYLSLPQRIL